MDDGDGQPNDLIHNFFDESLSDLERKELLQRTTREAAEIEIDLANGGPLASYIRSRRGEAKEALRVLVTTNPKDGVSIAMAQSQIAEYLRAIGWMIARLDEGEAADQLIESEYGRNGEARHDD